MVPSRKQIALIQHWRMGSPLFIAQQKRSSGRFALFVRPLMGNALLIIVNDRDRATVIRLPIKRPRNARIKHKHARRISFCAPGDGDKIRRRLLRYPWALVMRAVAHDSDLILSVVATWIGSALADGAPLAVACVESRSSRRAGFHI
jgi:hypothetical protein